MAGGYWTRVKRSVAQEERAVNQVGTGAMKNTGALLLAFLIIAGGCAKPKLYDAGESLGGIAPTQTVAVLAVRQRSVDFAECVLRGMHRANREITFIDSQEFRDTFFPWFETRTAPAWPEDLVLLLNKPLVQEKISQLGLRYIMSVSGTTRADEWVHNIEAGAGYGAPAVIGYGKKSYHTQIITRIWDLEEPASSTSLSVNDSGYAYYLCCMIPVFYVPSGTESNACKEMGEKLAQFMTDHGAKE